MKTDHVQFKEGVMWKPGFIERDLIIQVALETAPLTTDGILWITEIWRPAIRTQGVDLHNLNLAVDFRIHNIVVDSGLTEPQAYDARRQKAWGWVNRQRDIHQDSRFQFSVHGARPNHWMDPTIHLHAEYDPR